MTGRRAGKRPGSRLSPGLCPWGAPQRTRANSMLSVYSGVSSLNPLRKQLCKERENIWVRQGTQAQWSPSGCLQIGSYLDTKGESIPPVPALRGLRASCIVPGPCEWLAYGHCLLGDLIPLGRSIYSSRPFRPLQSFLRGINLPVCNRNIHLFTHFAPPFLHPWWEEVLKA